MSAQIPESYLACKHCAGLGIIKKQNRTAEHFPAFWAAWPKNERKQDKAACLTKWKTRNYDTIANAIMADLCIKKRTQRWAAGYIEAPLVYLNNRRWEDGVLPEEKPVDNSWVKTEQGTLAMAAKYQVTTRSGEDWPQLRERISLAMRG